MKNLLGKIAKFAVAVPLLVGLTDLSLSKPDGPTLTPA